MSSPLNRVSIQAVSRVFETAKGQRTQALQPVDFEVKDNDFVTILGPSGWVMTTHGVWFARQEGDSARIIHAVIYSPKPNHEVAQRFFGSLVLE